MEFIFVDGHLAKNAEKRTSNGGIEFITFSVGTHKRDMNGNEVTTWYDVVAFDVQRYERMFQYLTKGKYVMVRGKFDASIRQDRNGIYRQNLKITAESIDFSSSNSGQQQQNSTQPEPAQVGGYTPTMTPVAQPKPVSDDDISMYAGALPPAPESISNDSSPDELPF